MTELRLSKKQLDKIKYESMLLRVSPESLYVIAPHLFHEGITAANTEVKPSYSQQFEELSKQAAEFLKDDDEYHSFY